MAMRLLTAGLIICAAASASAGAQEDVRLPAEPVLSVGNYSGNWVGDWVAPDVYQGRWEGTYHARPDAPLSENEVPATRVIPQRSDAERSGGYAVPVGYGPRERAEWLAQCQALYGGEYDGRRDIYSADYCDAYLARYEQSFAGPEFGRDPGYGPVRWIRVPIRREPIPRSAAYDEMVTRSVAPGQR